MVIFAVIFAIFFCGIKKKDNSYFSNIYINFYLPFQRYIVCHVFLLDGAHTSRGHGRTPAKVRSNLKMTPRTSCWGWEEGVQPTCQKLVRGQTHTQSLFMSLEERERRLDSIEVRMVPCHHAHDWVQVW